MHACSCEILPPDLETNLTRALKESGSIYLVRVGAVKPPVLKGSLAVYEGEVLEVLKGALGVGQRLTINSGDGRGCRFQFTDGATVLVYAGTHAPAEVSMCSRTIPATACSAAATLNGARVADVFMSFIHTAELNKVQGRSQEALASARESPAQLNLTAEIWTGPR